MYRSCYCACLFSCDSNTLDVLFAERMLFKSLNVLQTQRFDVKSHDADELLLHLWTAVTGGESGR